MQKIMKDTKEAMISILKLKKKIMLLRSKNMLMKVQKIPP